MAKGACMKKKARKTDIAKTEVLNRIAEIMGDPAVSPIDFNEFMETKYTEVSLQHYHVLPGDIYRREKGHEISIAALAENPLEALVRIFPCFQVTKVCGYPLFLNNNPEPSVGLVLSIADKRSGINGKAEDIMRIKKARELLREDPVTEEELATIYSSLEKFKTKRPTEHVQGPDAVCEAIQKALKYDPLG